MPESVLCVFVCMHACAYALNAIIHTLRLLIQTTMEHKSINNRAIIQKKLRYFSSKGARGNERGGSNKVGLQPAGIFLALRKTFALQSFMLIESQ